MNDDNNDKIVEILAVGDSFVRMFGLVEVANTFFSLAIFPFDPFVLIYHVEYQNFEAEGFYVERTL